MFANNGNDDNKQSGTPGTYRTLGVLLGLMMQLATCTVVFGFIGRFLADRWHHPYITAVGIIVGLAVGMSGFVYLGKHFLGDRP